MQSIVRQQQWHRTLKELLASRDISCMYSSIRCVDDIMMMTPSSSRVAPASETGCVAQSRECLGQDVLASSSQHVTQHSYISPPQSIASSWKDYIVGNVMLWMAAPKKKVSPSRKGMRSATKFVRRVPIVSQCSKCERIFPPHAMPSKCEEEDCPAFTQGGEKMEVER
jgi:ribosomal protein L32